jgi:hypothetical protein
MAVLREEERHGWHVVEASDQPWDHRRVPRSARSARSAGFRRELPEAGGGAARREHDDPWGYWKRPTGRQVEA